MTTQPAYLTQTAGTSRYLTQTAGTNYYLTLQDPAAYANDVDLLLAEAVWYIDAHDAAYDGGQTVPNAGTAGTALNALLGGGTAVTTNDPTWLAYSAGTAYIYLSGVAGNSISTTAPASATQYAAYPASGGTATTGAATGGAAFTFSTTGSWRKVDLLTAGSAVTASFDCQLIASGAATSLTDAYGVSWTINRSTSGKKAALVGGWAGGGSLWLLGTDDYMEVADNDAIDFGATDSFTVLVLTRQYATPTSGGQVIAKKEGAAAGWLIRNQGTGFLDTDLVSDGTNAVSGTSATTTAGTLTQRVFVVNRTAQTVTGYANSTAGTPSSISAVGSMANAQVLRIGRGSGVTAAYQDFELSAAAIWRRALTANEVASLSTYFTTRAYNQSY